MIEHAHSSNTLVAYYLFILRWSSSLACTFIAVSAAPSVAAVAPNSLHAQMQTRQKIKHTKALDERAYARRAPLSHR